MKTPTLKEINELVTLRRDENGILEICDVRGDVRGNVRGDVYYSLLSNIEDADSGSCSTL